MSEAAVYSLARPNRIRRLWWVLAELQPLYKVSRTDRRRVCARVCVVLNLPSARMHTYRGYPGLCPE